MEPPPDLDAGLRLKLIIEQVVAAPGALPSGSVAHATSLGETPTDLHGPSRKVFPGKRWNRAESARRITFLLPQQVCHRRIDSFDQWLNLLIILKADRGILQTVSFGHNSLR